MKSVCYQRYDLKQKTKINEGFNICQLFSLSSHLSAYNTYPQAIRQCQLLGIGALQGSRNQHSIGTAIALLTVKHYCFAAPAYVVLRANSPVSLVITVKIMVLVFVVVLGFSLPDGEIRQQILKRCNLLALKTMENVH